METLADDLKDILHRLTVHSEATCDACLSAIISDLSEIVPPIVEICTENKDVDFTEIKTRSRSS